MTIEFGLEAFFESKDVSGRAGLITNATGRDRNGLHIVGRIAAHPRLKLVRIFTPEHGFGADAPDGEAVADGTHDDDQIKSDTVGRERKTDHKITRPVPIVSLYGPKKAPSTDDLDGLDMLIYDIQDVGTRFYTYISTLRNIIDAAGQTGIPVHVLDRPDLMGGNTIEGPMLTSGFESFVGHLPIALRYGLTPGELAIWWNNRRDKPAPLTIWPLKGWRRGMSFSDWGMPWVKPSPSMCSPATASFYPGTCLFEGTNLSEGRGTDAPFQIFGAPWVTPNPWREALQPLLPTGISVLTTSFVPTFSKFTGETCQGIRLESDLPLFENCMDIALHTIATFMKTHPERIEFNRRPTLPHPFFDHLAGCSWLRDGLVRGIPVDELVGRANEETKPFSQSRTQVLLYK
ncbi:MAG: DUF1343 domain-containing protein [Candidatus Riflebacteria bacterium]|nr:DUF1343 domain-containing protein [Candidatus Riflebacteria bacterium]